MSEKVCLQWNDFNENVVSAFKNLRENIDFADVTLACEDGQQVTAHRVVLAASSPLFESLLQRNNHSHLLIFMRGVDFEVLEAIVDFLYRGEANIIQENLDLFLAITEELQIKGFMGQAEEKERTDKTQKDPVKVHPATKVKQENKSSWSSKSIPYEKILGKESEATASSINFTGDLQELDDKVNSMMEKLPRRSLDGHPLYLCKVCGKESMIGNMKHHIEQHHIQGVSIPCDHCEKTFRSRKMLATHNVGHNKM